MLVPRLLFKILRPEVNAEAVVGGAQHTHGSTERRQRLRACNGRELKRRAAGCFVHVFFFYLIEKKIYDHSHIQSSLLVLRILEAVLDSVPNIQSQIQNASA